MYYGIVILGFFLDIALYALCQVQWIYIIRCIYYAQLVTKPSLSYLLVPGVLVMVESSLYGGCCGMDLIVMIPLTWIGYKLNKIMKENFLLSVLMALSAVLIHMLVIDYGLFAHAVSCLFTLKSLCIHGILIMLLIKYIVQR